MPSTDHPDAIPTLTVDQRRALTLLGVRITHPGTFAVTTRHRFHGTATTDAVAAMRLADSLRVLADGIDHAIGRNR